jgi:hypothetical protein
MSIGSFSGLHKLMQIFVEVQDPRFYSAELVGNVTDKVTLRY